MIQELFSLGKIYPSDFLKADEQPRCEPVELKLMMDEQGMVFLNEQPEANLMWGEKYWYHSSTSHLMRRQLTDIVSYVLSVLKYKEGEVWTDIGGNDSFMLSQVPKKLIRINIDPCNDYYKFEPEMNWCDLVIQDYFSSNVYKQSKYGDRKSKYVTCISMFYDIPNADAFLQDVFEILDNEGVFCLQMSYTPLMLEQLEFSNICHEHKFYYSLFNIKPLLERNGFKIMDVSLNNTNAGSFRICCIKKWANENIFTSPTDRDVCKFRVNSLLSYEKTLGLDKVSTWHHFFTRINELKFKTTSFIKDEINNGKVIYGYGASTKGATMLGYFGLGKEFISAIADRNFKKHGLRTAGTDIPIISEEEMREEHPDYLFIMPFHFLSEFMEREREYLLKGGKFIVPLPSFKIITKDDL